MASQSSASLEPSKVLTTSKVLVNAKRWVVKVGSSLVTNDGKGLDQSAIDRWANEIAALRSAGAQVVLVSSGAIAEGMLRLGFAARPTAINELQACAAVGQMGLIQSYESNFSKLGLKTAQVLLTHADLADRDRYLNARNTLLTLLSLGVVPIINENDTVVTDEIKVGDNDTLGALVANLIDADCLVILTDQQGLYSADPRKDNNAQFINLGRAGDVALEAMAGGAGSSLGKGGMLTKILAAKRAATSGTHTAIAWGREPRVLQRLAAGESIGTFLVCETPKLAARKQWLSDHLQTRGRVVIDAGATKALVSSGRSLLPIGVLQVAGEFARGEVIAVFDEQGKELARGLTNYASAETRLIARKPSSEIVSILGFDEGAELIHRDNLVVL
jgi:glutamate 5-kinase